MARSSRRTLTDIANETTSRLEAVDAIFGAPAKPEADRWLTPSIQLSAADVMLLRRVATERAGRGRVSISAVIQGLIEMHRADLEAEAEGTNPRQDGRTAER
jgi:hypothetical protein